jgi:hypothetical protein
VLRYVRALEVEIDNFGARLESLDIEHREEIAKLQRQLVANDREIGRLSQELAVARERLNTTSRNSSRPPSLDPPLAPKREPSKPGRRRRGAQPGHEFHPRELYPVDQCASVTDHRSEICGECGAPLEHEDPNPVRHQIVDMPAIAPVVHEHRLHAVRCAGCGAMNRARLPEGIASTGFGPGVEGTIATLVAECRLSHRLVVAVMRDLCGVRIGLGTVSNLLRRASASTADSVEEAYRYIRDFEGPKHVDETGWKHRNADGTNDRRASAWIWVAATQNVTVFKTALSRAQGVAKELVGEAPRGTLVSDRYLVYRYARPETRQVCWSHLERDFRRISERTGPSARLGWKLLRVARTLFRLHGRWRKGKLKHTDYEYRMGRLRMELRDLLRQGAMMDIKSGGSSPSSMTKRTCLALQEIEPALWTFVGTPGVEPTNNFAERQLRHAVMLRKISAGSQSADGMTWMSRLLTVVMTTRSQGRNPHEFLVESARAAHAKTPPPSLLPPNPASDAAPGPPA